MKSATDRIVEKIRTIPTVRSETGVFVEMDGPLAVVNIGPSTVRIPCIGFTPPAAGMDVQIEWRDGRPAVIGPAVALNPIGVIAIDSSPKAGVIVDGVTYNLYFQDGYNPTVGDEVVISWSTAGGVILGKVSGTDTPAPPPTNPTTPGKFSGLKVKATRSGRYQGSWWGTDPWASNNNDGIWTYGDRIKDALGSATVTRIEIFLPLLERLGNCAIGVHPHATIPGGSPSIGSTVNLPFDKRNGWVGLPLSFATYLAAGGRGIGVTTDIGLNKWKGVDRDSDSGALRFTGTR